MYCPFSSDVTWGVAYRYACTETMHEDLRILGSLRNNLNFWLQIRYITRNMHTVFALLCFVVVIHWLIFPYPSGLFHWHCGNLTIAPVPAKQPWWIWINTSCEFIMNDCITTTKQSTTKTCAYFLRYTVWHDDILTYAIITKLLLINTVRTSTPTSLIRWSLKEMDVFAVCFKQSRWCGC